MRAAALLLLLSACNNPCKPGPDPTLDVGLGFDGFAPIEAPAPLQAGNQGGFHLDLALRTTYLEGRDLLAGELDGWLDGQLVARGRPWFQLECVDDAQQATGLRLILEGEPASVLGETLAVDVSLTDSRGVTVIADVSLAVQESL